MIIGFKKCSDSWEDRLKITWSQRRVISAKTYVEKLLLIINEVDIHGQMQKTQQTNKHVEFASVSIYEA